jgi:hypothetical protein
MSAFNLRLQETIQNYWRERGHPQVIVIIASQGERAGSPPVLSSPVRSNLRNGLPPGVTMRRGILSLPC